MFGRNFIFLLNNTLKTDKPAYFLNDFLDFFYRHNECSIYDWRRCCSVRS